MSSKKISQLPAAGILDGTEEFAINQSGLTSKVTLDEIKTYSQPTNVILSEKISLTSSAIRSMGTNPILLLSAPGSGKFIQIISITYRKIFISPAYATSTSAILMMDGNSIGSSIDLNFTINKTNYSASLSIDTAANISNKAVYLTTLDGVNPTAGNGTIDVYINYIILDL
jgi:hypothetical protein